MLPELASPVALVCHDAGAANQLIAWLKAMPLPSLQIRPVMQGPAATLWVRAFPEHPLTDNLSAALAGAKTLVSGSGWASSLEHDARCMAANAGVVSIAVLDHWVNYSARFERASVRVLPDEFWVADDDAYAIASAHFQGKKIRQLPNLYMKSQLDALPLLPDKEKKELLYLGEPARSTWGHTAQGEFQALDYFVAHLEQLGLPASTPIRLRLHPSEPRDKYDAWIDAHTELNLMLDQSEDLAAALANAHWVVGCESYAMVLALAAGRTVYCALPPWAPACRLPQAGIQHIQEIGSPR